MDISLIFDYLCIQIPAIILAVITYKRMTQLMNNDEKNSGYGIGSSFGLLLSLVAISVIAFYSNFFKHEAFGAFIVDVIMNIFKN